MMDMTWYSPLIFYRTIDVDYMYVPHRIIDILKLLLSAEIYKVWMVTSINQWYEGFYFVDGWIANFTFVQFTSDLTWDDALTDQESDIFLGREDKLCNGGTALGVGCLSTMRTVDKYLYRSFRSHCLYCCIK